ncbi:MAG: polymer-forming cytoskeletal protein [Bacteroidota bacterium]
MNTSISPFLAVLILCLAPACETASVSPEDETPNHIVLGEGEVHEGWFFAAGETVIIRGTVNGDAYLAGANVEVDGVINGDLLVVGGNVTLRGSVTHDVRACGGNVRIDGKVGKDATACGGTVEVGSLSVVEGNFLAVGRSVSLSGRVRKNAKLAGRDITVMGVVEEDAELAAENVVILRGARFERDLSIRVSERDKAHIAEGAVGGELTLHVEEESSDPEALILGLSPFQFGLRLYWFLSLLVVGLVLAHVLPDQMYAVGRFIWGRPIESFLWGIIGLVAIPVVVLLVCITVIGLPLALFLLVMYFWLLFLTQLSLGIVLGHLIFPVEDKEGFPLFGAFAVGLIIVQVFTFVPVANIVVVLLGFVLGMGAFLLLLKAELSRLRGA